MQDVSLDSLVPTKSDYLSKEDVGEAGRNLTIAGFKIESVGSGNEAEDKCILVFQETDVKPMIVNKTNMARIKHVTGAETTGQARNKVINVYNDPMIEYQGKLTGGTRVRPASTATLEPQSAPMPDDLSDLPF